MLRFAEISLGDPERSPCRRCEPPLSQRARDTTVIIEELASAARDWPGGPGPNVAILGLSPLQHPGIVDVLRAAVDLGFQRVRLSIDAADPLTPESSRFLLGNGVRHVQCDLLGSDVSLHDGLCGIPGDFEAVLQAVRVFSETADELGLRVQTSARVPVCRHNLQDLPAIVTTAAEKGISYVRLVVEDEALDLWAAAPWLEAACDTGIVYATWVEVEGVPFGPAAGWELHLASIYRPIGGSKSSLCATCPLDSVCSGAPHGAMTSVTGRLRPPGNAQEIASDIQRTHIMLAGSNNG